jgi:integrase/recombinase XerD
MDNNKLVNLHKEFIGQLAHMEKLAPATIKGYETTFNLLMQCFPDLTLVMIDSKMINRFFRWLDERERTIGRDKVVKSIKKSTVATHWSGLSRFFKWLKAHKHIDSNPFDSEELEYPVVQYEDRKYLRKREVERIMASINFHIDWRNSFIRKRNFAIINTFLYTGIRSGELLGLKLESVDFNNNELTINPETSKSRRLRVVPINNKLKVALQDYLKERKIIEDKSEYLWVSGRRDKFTNYGLKHTKDQIVKKSGVKFHLHQFRHTFAVNYLNVSKYNYYKLQQLLGHKDPRMTAKYTRSLPTGVMKGDCELIRVDDLIE